MSAIQITNYQSSILLFPPSFTGLFSIVQLRIIQMDNQAEQFGIETIAYEELETQFQEVLSSLSSDQTLDRFRIEYERIHRALRHSHEQEKKLLGRCRDLSKDIIAGAAKLQSALKFSNDDSHTISYLKAEVAKTYKYLELSREHEELSKQKIERLKAEMKKLHMLMEQNDSITEGQVASVHQYTIANEELEKEKEILQISLDSNKTELSEVRSRIEASESQKEALRRQFQQLQLRKEAQEKRVKEEEQSKKSKKDELEVIKAHFDRARAEEGTAKDSRKQLNDKYKELTTQTYQLQILAEKERKFLKKLEKEEAVETKKMQEIQQINGNLRSLMRLKEKELTATRESLNKEKSKHTALIANIDQMKEEVAELNNQRSELEQLRERIAQGLAQLENQLNQEKKSEGRDRTFIEKLKRQRDMYKKEVQRTDLSNKKLLQEILNREKQVKEKENELFGQKKEIQKLNKTIITLEKQRDANSFQATSAEAKYFYSRDQVKLRDNFIAEFQKQNIQTQAKLKKQQSLYEAVRSDRNLVKKKLSEVQEQKSEYSNRYKRVTHQITQLKEQIDAKENELVKQHTEHSNKDKKIETEQKKIEKFKKDIADKEDKIRNFFVEKNKLEAIIKEIEYEKQKLQEQYELVVSERDILGTQLIRRSAEADLLYEKIKINQSALKKGQAQYHQKIIEIQTQKEEIAALMNDIKAYRAQNAAIADLRAQIHNLTRELTESRLKVKALSKQIEKPMNIHRWRKLEATDSSTFDMMTKIQSIQKRLIAKTEEVRAKESQLEQKEQELKSLQQVLKRQPSVEEQRMIPVYQDTLDQKHRQIQSMRDEIENYDQTILEYKIEYERLQKELQTYKQKFFTQKKREQQAKEDKKAQEDYIKVILPDKRFTGGGFNLAI